MNASTAAASLSSKRSRLNGADATLTATHHVALIGDAFVDINLSGLTRLPAYGIDVPCGGVSITIGGSCANTARQLASIGAPSSIAATFFSCVGGDSMGEHFRRSVAEEGLLADCETSLHTLPGVAQS